ncbi:MAG: type II secretion system protein GspG [Cellvibrionales bacterium]|nr:type II secretion system protein GspG [Cellvibrionales bacterium]|tara:strand:+ start:10031 stop:10480 length:450 start_codon:yes stop_codon:yes gene_type:complete
MKYTYKKKQQQGFSLIEVLVVVVIMGMLIGLIGPNVLGQVDRARVTTAKSDIASLSQALDMYKLDNHFYPTTDQGLEALVSRPQSSPEPRNWNPEGYIKGNKLPLDPWDGEYVYMSPGEENRPYELISLGADARLGGEGYASDISSSDR